MATIESECAAVDCCLLDAVKSNEDPSSFENSCMGLQRFDSPKNNGEHAVSVPVSGKRSGGHGGFTCCVPGCFSNNKKNPELFLYNFPNCNSEESRDLQKKWINLISRKDFSPTSGHRVCSLHFPGGKKSYMNKLPLNVPKATKPTPTNPQPTIKRRN